MLANRWNQFRGKTMCAAVFAILGLLLAADTASGGDLVPFQKADKWGFKDATGKIVIEPKYDNVGKFSSGLAPVNLGAKMERYVNFAAKLGGKWGYVDVRGELVVPIMLDYAHEFSDGLAWVSDEKGTRYIDLSGKVVIDIGFDGNAGDFHEGLAPIREDRSVAGKDWRTRCIDKNGHTAFVVEGFVEDFSDGMAALSVKQEKNDSHFSIERKVYGYIDRSGRVAIPPRFAEALAFHEGLAAVRTKKTTIYRKGDTWGYIDKSGRYVIQPRFNEAHPFQNGVARVHVGGTLLIAFDMPADWDGGQWQLIDRAGKVLKQSNKWLEYEDAPANSRQPQSRPAADQPKG